MRDGGEGAAREREEITREREESTREREEIKAALREHRTHIADLRARPTEATLRNLQRKLHVAENVGHGLVTHKAAIEDMGQQLQALKHQMDVQSQTLREHDTGLSQHRDAIDSTNSRLRSVQSYADKSRTQALDSRDLAQAVSRRR
jgi:chromosome segregation ATPase